MNVVVALKERNFGWINVDSPSAATLELETLVGWPISKAWVLDAVLLSAAEAITVAVSMYFSCHGRVNSVEQPISSILLSARKWGMSIASTQCAAGGAGVGRG